MKKALVTAAMIFAAVSIFAAEKSGMTYKRVPQNIAYETMQNQRDIIILDVRTKEEFKQGHIKGAICIPVETIGNVPPKELPDKNQTILVYCRSGRRSKNAAEKLVKLGYTDIREFGGINTWVYGTVK